MKLQVQGPDGTRFFKLSASGAAVVAGRGVQAKIRLADLPGISRDHIEFRSLGNFVRLKVVSTKLGATTSKGVVGPGEEVDLGPGDTVTLCDYVMTIQPAEPIAGLAVVRMPDMSPRGQGSFSGDTSGAGDPSGVLQVVPGPSGAAAHKGRDAIGTFLSGQEPPGSSHELGELEVIVDSPPPPPEPPWPPQPNPIAGPEPGFGDLPSGWREIVDQIKGEIAPNPAPLAPPPAACFDPAAFAEGLGVTLPQAISSDDWRRIGSTLREVTAALNQLMLDRATLKSELRALNKTQVYVSDKNPYKARQSTDELLRALLFKGAASESAVREAVDDLRAHNLAIIAASRESVVGTVSEFSPDKLKRHLSTSRAARLVALMEHGQLWASYVQYYSEKSTHMADWLEALFERHFVEAYSREAERLKRTA